MSLPEALIDTHCHLDAAEFDADRDALVAAAKVGAGGTATDMAVIGVAAIIVPAVERANFGAVTSICRDYVGCAPAYGIHPLYVGRAKDEDLAILDATLRNNVCVAVGEIGLDDFVAERDEALQERYFIAQLEIARQQNLPVLLHVRRAIDKVLKLLRQHPVPGGIAHAFNGSRQQADEFIKLGFKLGFGGAMTFAGSKRIRELAATLPLDSIVLETDAPDIPPQWKVGARNTPADLLPIAETLAQLRGLSLAEVAAATSANAHAVLPRLKDFQTSGEA
jgi:TatD DNase family protein